MLASKWFTVTGTQVLQGLGAVYGGAFNAVAEATDGLEGRDAFFIQVVHAFKPEPLTPQDVIIRIPYANPESFKADMAASVERGWLEAVGEEQYMVSDKGAEVAARLVKALNGALAGVESLPKADLERICDLLQKVVDRAYELPEPAEKWVLEWGKYFDKALVVEGAPALIKVRRRTMDVFSFRDDGHVAAWKAREENGQIWEAFTFVWRGDASDAAELAEKLAFRNYDEASYAAALDELAARGWVAQEGDKYVATDKGKELRQGVEDATDRCFDVPWDALTKAETEELKSLMERLTEAVKPSEENE